MDDMNAAGNWVEHVIQRTKARATGRLNNNQAASELVGHGHIALANMPFATESERLSSLLKACRRTSLPSSRELLKKKLQPYLVGGLNGLCRNQKVGWGQYFGEFGELGTRHPLTTSLVLKAPKPNGEKGVLYCSFEYNWMRLVAHHDAAAILSDYYLVGASSWSPTDYAVLAAFAGLSQDPIFIGVSNFVDVDRLALMRPVVEPLPILASDWVDPDCYAPKPQRERTIDILMVANWSRVKRHWLLFEALRDMPSHLRMVLVGRNAPGRTEREILAEARAFGVRQHLELHTNLEIDEVTALQCDARVSLIFSRREGSCVSTAESLFAGSPVGMMDDAHIGSRAYLNSRTGATFSRNGLARSLKRFWAESDSYAPREWALENISCQRSSQRLNSLLRDWSLRAGRPWTEDIAPLRWRYVPAYVDPADEKRLAPAVEELKRKHGVELEKFLGERASLRQQTLRTRPDTAEASAGHEEGWRQLFERIARAFAIP
jgi:glycosyltransferase involved in cell wall biosynthesis